GPRRPRRHRHRVREVGQAQPHLAAQRRLARPGRGGDDEQRAAKPDHRPRPAPPPCALLKILHLFAHLLDQALRRERRLADLEVVGLRGDRVDLAVQLLDQEVERPADGPAAAQHLRELLEVRAEPDELLTHVGLLRPDRHLAEDPPLVDRRLAEERPDPLPQASVTSPPTPMAAPSSRARATYSAASAWSTRTCRVEASGAGKSSTAISTRPRSRRD